MPARLRRARCDAKLSQVDIAERLGISRSAVAQWEQSAGTSPSTANLAQVATMTGVRFEWLATGRGHIRPTGDEFEVAVTLADFAQDHVETRVLELLRRLPAKRRAVACRLLEALID
ncbi:helix-turn-helix domain-containing protein [Cognatiluteimonas telluris]|uniref:helix-turn-helix domain-containing protein n=1 Tax=Cognatiluteimonas telluris TaxID=1104775 RepID=UPI0024345FD0|nr:helix-turn-helix transcriptional regulator [Lysobacter telluris]